MRIKPLSKRSWQSFPVTDGMIEVDDGQVREIGKTLEFDETLTKLVPLIQTDEDIVKQGKQEKIKHVAKLRKWFEWYDNQVAQEARARRLSIEWQAVNGDKVFNNLVELDNEANKRHNELRALLEEVKQ